ncbi:MAG: DNA polymerase/3'-5' exonuclease PolX [Planctomycetota bacterium]|nr:MAG: DNA polymerase/3'-5' exonuclease PolX [Planctomycetota bacterium]
MSFNRDAVRLLNEIASMMELLGENPFKINAHARAARAIEGMSQDLGAATGDRSALTDIEGIGPKIADKLIELAETGGMSEHAALAEKVPAGPMGLLNIPGLGPKTVRLLWQERGVTDLAGLKAIIEDGSILELPRMGKKAVEKIAAAIKFAEQDTGRLHLGVAMPVAETVVEHMRGVKGVTRVTFAGSLRRGKETVGDIDILVCADDPVAAGEAFRTMPEVVAVLAAGDTKSSVRYGLDVDLGRWNFEGRSGDAEERPSVQVDLRVVDESSWGAALLYFSGSKEHNVRLRERALKQDLTLNEYGLFPEDREAEGSPQSRGVKPVAAATEEEIYAKLGLVFVPPELREDRGELALDETPALIEVGDIKAELHAHTTESDGSLALAELVAGAKERGFHTIAVTDHSKSAAVAGGLTVKRLRAQRGAIDAARQETKGITILHGSEVDILADGELDYDDEILAWLDVVVASPHAALSQDPKAATKRLLRAIENPHVNIIGHPTGRLINKRPGIEPAMDEIYAAAKEHDVALEINAHWLRLDLRDTHVRGAVEAECLIAIDCDVHRAGDFDNLRYGVLTGRRGWLPKDRCINTWSAKKLQGWLAKKHG